jgi:predicted Zn-dependent protease
MEMDKLMAILTFSPVQKRPNMMHAARRLLLGLCVTGFAFLAVGCTTDKQVISQANSVHSTLAPAVIDDPQLQNYLQQIGDRIVDAARRAGDSNAPEAHLKGDNDWMFSNAMKFYFVNSPDTVNAFTTGGEQIYIYTALFEQCKSEDELAAVVAHEYAHVYCRHIAQSMDNQYKILGGAALAGAVGAAIGYEQDKTQGAVTYGTAGLGAGMALGQFVGMGFTRGQENEADKYGFNFYVLAGWDPAHFADFFKRMIELGYDTTPELASDHPTLKSRVEATQRRVSQLPAVASQWRRPPIIDDAQFQQLRARAIEVGKSMPNDKTLQQAQQLLAGFASCVAPIDQPSQRAAKEQAIKAAQAEQEQQEQ